MEVASSTVTVPSRKRASASFCIVCVIPASPDCPTSSPGRSQAPSPAATAARKCAASASAASCVWTKTTARKSSPPRSAAIRSCCSVSSATGETLPFVIRRGPSSSPASSFLVLACRSSARYGSAPSSPAHAPRKAAPLPTARQSAERPMRCAICSPRRPFSASSSVAAMRLFVCTTCRSSRMRFDASFRPASPATASATVSATPARAALTKRDWSSAASPSTSAREAPGDAVSPISFGRIRAGHAR